MRPQVAGAAASAAAGATRQLDLSPQTSRAECARGASDGGRGSGRSGRGRGGGGGASAAVPMRPAVPVPKEDFNFEEALSKFDKEKAVEVRASVLPQAGHALCGTCFGCSRSCACA